MSLYSVSPYNIGLGINSAGTFDSIGTAVITDRDGNTVATLNAGVATFINSIIGSITLGTISDGTSTGTNGQYLSSIGSGVQWNTLSIGNGALTLSGTHISSTSGTFTANQSTNSTITLTLDATNLNTASTIVARDASGNFSAGTISAILNGRASSAINLSGGAAYQIVYQSSAGTTAYLTNGTANYILQATSGAPQWIRSVPLASSIAGGSTWAIPIQNAVDQTVFLNPGTSGFLLTTNGTGLLPIWSDPGTLSVGSATNATNIITTLVDTSIQHIHYVSLVPTNVTGSQAVYMSDLTYNTNTNYLNAACYSATFAGTATNGNFNYAYDDVQYNIVFTIGTGSQQFYIDSLLTYDPYYHAFQFQSLTVNNNYIQQDNTLTGTYIFNVLNNGIFTITREGVLCSSLFTNAHPTLTILSNPTFAYSVGNGNLQGTYGTGQSCLALTDVVNSQWAMTSGTNMSFQCDSFVTNTFGNILQLSQNGILKVFTNTLNSPPLDRVALTIDSLPFAYSSSTYQTSSVTGNNPGTTPITYVVTIKCAGNNPFNRTITLSFCVDLNFQITLLSTGNSTFQVRANSGVANLIGGSSPTPTIVYTGLNTNYGFTPVGATTTTIWNVMAPIGMVSMSFVPTNTGAVQDTYTFTVPFTFASTIGTGQTISSSGVYGNGQLVQGNYTTSYTAIRTSGTGTLTAPTLPTVTLLSSSRSGSDNLLSIDPSVQVSASTVQTTSSISASAFYPALVPLNTSSGNTGQQVVTSASAITVYPSTNIAYVPLLNSTKNASFAGATSYVVTNCFNASFAYYDITIKITDALNAGQYLNIDLHTGSARATAGWFVNSFWNGSVSGSVSSPASAQSVAAISTIPNAQPTYYNLRLYNPFQATWTGLEATNNFAYVSSSYVCWFSTGTHNQSTSYPALFLTTSGTSNLNGSISVRGFN